MKWLLVYMLLLLGCTENHTTLGKENFVYRGSTFDIQLVDANYGNNATTESWRDYEVRVYLNEKVLKRPDMNNSAEWYNLDEYFNNIINFYQSEAKMKKLFFHSERTYGLTPYVRYLVRVELLDQENKIELKVGI